MKNLLHFLLAAAAVELSLHAQLLPQVPPEQVGLSRERLDRIKPLLERWVAEDQLAGGTLLVARRGKVAYFDTFGFMDAESRKPMTKDAIFRIYSMTKPIIAVGLLQLYEEGKFSPRDPLSKYLPEFTDMKVLMEKIDPATGKRTTYTVPANRPIMVLDVMRHTWGGSTPGPLDDNGKPMLSSLNYRQYPLAEGIKLMATVPLLYQPGAYWRYSPGTDILGRLIEVLSGKSLDEYLEERLFKPLNMPDTAFWVPEPKWNRLAVLYDRNPKDGTIVRATNESGGSGAQPGFKTKPPYFSGAGGLTSTTVDYLRFAQMLVNGGELEGVRILGPKTVQLMGSDLLGDIPVMEPSGADPHPGYGFGVQVAVNLGPAKTASVGSRGEFYWEGAGASIFFIDQKEKLTAVYMTQKRPGLEMSRIVKRMIYTAITEPEEN